MSYEKLDVYKCAINFLSIAINITNEMPRGQAGLADQIKRAAMSIPLNIGEGAGKRTRADCARYFDIARGSAMECAAAIDVCKVLSLISDDKQKSAKDLLHRIVAMLTKLARYEATPLESRLAPPPPMPISPTSLPTSTKS